MEIISTSSHALSSNEIENKLQDPDRITLYRTLKSFEEKGVIHRAIDGTQAAKYAICDSGCDEHSHQHQHVHFHCEKCGNTFCVDEVAIPDISMPSGYKIKDINIIVEGQCEKCS